MGEYNYMMGSSLPSKQESATESSSKINNPRVSSMSASSSSSPWLKLKDPRIVRVSRGFGGKDRHSKVSTIRGLRDRRVRLSVPTAIQLYDLQDRLGLNQPSKVVDWLLDAAKDEIEELPPLPMIDPVKLGEAQWMEQTSRFEEIEEQEQEHVAMESDLMYQRPVAAHDTNLLFPYQMDPQQHQVVEDYNPHQGFQTQPNNNGSNYLPLPYLRTSLVENIMDPSHHVGDHHHHHHHQLLQTGSSGSHNFFFNSPYSVCHHHNPSGERIPLDFDVNARATAPPSDKNED